MSGHEQRLAEAQAQERVRKAAPALLAALRGVEWANCEPNGCVFCPTCVGGRDEHGHAENCVLDAALRLAEEKA